MRRTTSWIAAALLAFAPAAALADHHEPGEHGAEHHSDKAAERSNAQWSEDAKKGQERADEVRQDAKAKADAEAKAKQDAAAKAKAKGKAPETP